MVSLVFCISKICDRESTTFGEDSQELVREIDFWRLGRWGVSRQAASAPAFFFSSLLLSSPE